MKPMFKSLAVVAACLAGFAASVIAQDAKPAAEAKPETKPAPTTVKVTLETSKGTIELELDGVKAPISTANFVNYVKKGHYDGTIFHRVIPGFMIQGGGFTADMQQKAVDAPIKNEGQNGLKNDTGTIAMARTSVLDSATSQFFINTVNNDGLNYPNNGGYAVFGKVTKGLDVVKAIEGVATGNKGMHQNVPTEPVVIKSAKVAE